MSVPIVLAGQTPPPVGGQAIMLESLLRADADGSTYHHVRLTPEQNLKGTGKFRIGKVLATIGAITRILSAKVKLRSTVLYYPFSGHSGRGPLYRDVLVIGATRLFFKELVYHHHASGFGDQFAKLRRIERQLVRLALFKPSLSILISRNAPREDLAVRARAVEYAANAISWVPDQPSRSPRESATIHLLFVGLICEGKGADRIIDVVLALRNYGVPCHVTLAGEFVSDDYESHLRDRLASTDLGGHFAFPGIVTGSAKDVLFRTADIFLFPSQFAAETSPLVLIEAMAYRLPIVTSDWRAIPDLVIDGENGYCVAGGDPVQSAARVRGLVADPRLAHQMGTRGRERYEQNHQLPDHVRTMARIFDTLLEARR